MAGAFRQGQRRRAGDPSDVSPANPTLDAPLVEQALEEDPAAARAEWLGEWRDDLASFIDLELIEYAIDRGVLVRPSRPGVPYLGFVDAQRHGSGRFAVAIAHKDGDEIILDLAHEVSPPFSPSEPSPRFARCSRLWRQVGRGRQVSAGLCDGGLRTASGPLRLQRARQVADLCRGVAPVDERPCAADRQQELDAQFASLERRTSPVGRDRIDHGAKVTTTLATRALVLVLVASGLPIMTISDEVLRLAAIM